MKRRVMALLCAVLLVFQLAASPARAAEAVYFTAINDNLLPLSDSSHLSADLGTRHRAGVGMSEVSDAVVVIVSEETGTISVAVGGMLKRHLAPQTLEKLLRNELCPKNDPDGEQVLALRLKKSLRKTDKEANTREK